MTHFLHQLPCTLFISFSLYVHAFIEQSFEKEWEFSFRISFPVIIICLPGGKTVQFLCNPFPNSKAVSGRGKRVRVRLANVDGGWGWKEHRKGDPSKCLAPSDLLNGFSLSGYRESGWEGSSVLPTPFGASVHRHGHSVATRLHTPLLMCKEANKQTTSDVSHTLHNAKKHKMPF